MPRYEFKSGGSEKFWEIHQEGDQYTVRYGKIGTNGQSQTKTFADEAKAQKEAEKVTKSKVKKGYVLVAEEAAVDAPAVDPATGGRNPELEAAIIANYEDEEAWSVYADWLGTEGDVRGELINLATQLAKGPNPQIEKRCAEIEEAHLHEWMGPSLAKIYKKAQGEEEFDFFLKWTWERGFLKEAKVNVPYDWEGPSAVTTLNQIIQSPGSRFLRSLAFGLLDMGDYEGETNTYLGIQAITRSGKVPSLRHLHIGAFEYPDQTEISWTSVGDVDKVYPVFPNLEFLHVQGGGIGLGKLKHAKLKKLRLETGGLPGDAIKSLMKADLPELEVLEAFFGDRYYGSEGNVEMIQPLLDGKVFPKLKSLGLMNSQFANEIAAALPGSAILKRVEALDLSLGTLTDTGARHLVDNADAFRHLKTINLDQSFVSNEVCEELQAALSNDVTLHLNSQDNAEDDDDTYCSVSE